MPATLDKEDRGGLGTTDQLFTKSILKPRSNAREVAERQYALADPALSAWPVERAQTRMAAGQTGDGEGEDAEASVPAERGECGGAVIDHTAILPRATAQ